jgi:protein TonB
MGTFLKHFNSRRLLFLILFSLSACASADLVPQPESRAGAADPLKDTAPVAGPNSVSADEGVQTLSNPAPRYPQLARGRGHEGTVLVEAVVDERGVPTGVRIKESSGHSLLDEAAVAAVKKWRFLPARSGGKAVAARVVAPIEFRLLKSGIPGGKPRG